MKQKSLKMENKSSLEDRISTLPVSLIHHISSFLDIKEVIQTSILSKRWRNLWKSTPYLNFYLECDDYSMYQSPDYDYRILSASDKLERESFTNFVDRVLFFRDGGSAIHKFDLDTELPLDTAHLHTWLIDVLRRNVLILRLSLNVDDELFELPQEIFTSDISVLKVNGLLALLHRVQVPSDFCSAAKIETLRLVYVKLPEGNSEGELVLRCPLLKRLTMCTCEDSHLKTFTVAAVLLRKLKWSNESPSPCKIHICSPNLRSIEVYKWLSPACGAYSIEKLSALTSANIGISRSTEELEEYYEQCLIKVLKAISTVNSLKLLARIVKDVTDSPKISNMLPDLLRNLSDIVIEEGNYNRGSTSALANLLKRLPWIRSFVWDRNKCDPLESTDEDKDLESLPEECRLHSLKTIEIRNPLGDKNEIEFLKFLLDRATALKEIIITETENTKVSEDARNKFLTLPGAASVVLIRSSRRIQRRRIGRFV